MQAHKQPRSIRRRMPTTSRTPSEDASAQTTLPPFETQTLKQPSFARRCRPSSGLVHLEDAGPQAASFHHKMQTHKGSCFVTEHKLIYGDVSVKMQAKELHKPTKLSKCLTHDCSVRVVRATISRAQLSERWSPVRQLSVFGAAIRCVLGTWCQSTDC